MTEDEYIPVEQAAAILGVSLRQASRYATKVRTRRLGQRILYNRTDIEDQAQQKRIKDQIHEDAQPYRPAPKQPQAELMPPGELLNYLRERDLQVTQLQQQLVQAAHRIGELEAQLQQQRLLANEATQLRQRLLEAEAELDALRTQLDENK